MYKFVVCKDVDLPSSTSRDENTIYYVYDKLVLYKGGVLYTDPFVITTELPTELPPDYILYILIYSGDIYQAYEKKFTKVATISDISQLQYLKLTGSTFFMKSDYRYLDIHSKSIILPYNNGKYQLTVDLANDISIDQNLVVKFDPKNSKFIFDGDLQEPVHGEWYRMQDYKGSATKTAITRIENKVVKTDIRISKDIDNMIQLYGDGLFVYTGDKASLSDFQKLVKEYNEYKTGIDNFQAQISFALGDSQNVLDTLPQKIKDAMNAYSSTMTEVLEKYDKIAAQMQKLSDSTDQYMKDHVNTLTDQVENYLGSINSAWEYF